MNKRIEAIIDTKALIGNAKTLLSLTNEGTQFIAVVKANAYGHGAVACSKLLEEMDDVSVFAVATPSEAIELRRAGIVKPVMLLGLVFEEDIRELLDNDIILTVSSFDDAKAIDEAAKETGKSAGVFIACDTGMRRIGFFPTGENVDEVEKISKLDNVAIKGAFTHFSKADEEDLSFTKTQFDDFMLFVDMLKARHIEVPYLTASNSAGTVSFPEANLDAIRSGILLYGLMPSDECARAINMRNIDIKPVMTLKSHIIYLKDIEEGDAVSYGGTYIARGKRKIATIPVGYADGYPRSLSGKGSVLIRGQKAKIAGRVCMDQFMVDVTDIEDVACGDEVVLMGKQGDLEITAEEISLVSGRFNYELVCDFSGRVPRSYK